MGGGPARSGGAAIRGWKPGPPSRGPEAAVGSPDTIAAIASPAGRGAVGVIRVSGPLVPQIATGILGSLPAPRQARFSSFLDAQGKSVDEGLALYFPAPASYTGGDVLELQGHGGALIVCVAFRRLLQPASPMSRPQQFIQRPS